MTSLATLKSNLTKIASADARMVSEAARFSLARRRFIDAPDPTAPHRPYENIPNAITIGGYVCQLMWILGGPWPLALVGLIADEADGRVARAVDETSDFGSLLDWGVDMTMTGLCAVKAGLGWSLPVTTIAQVMLRQRGMAPSVGSARALYTVIALARGR